MADKIDRLSLDCMDYVNAKQQEKSKQETHQKDDMNAGSHQAAVPLMSWSQPVESVIRVAVADVQSVCRVASPAQSHEQGWVETLAESWKHGRKQRQGQIDIVASSF